MAVNLNDLQKPAFELYPVGVYELELDGCKSKMVGEEKRHEKIVFFTKIVSPREFADKKFTFDLFSNDWRIGDILTSVSKKTLKELSLNNPVLDDIAMLEIIGGRFIKVRIGQREYNGKKYNEIAEIITDKKNTQIPSEV